ncbi:hypothetical protein [Proteiniphilum sp. X52]|uniref:hypothetical protein n=1 Tax=Proteiniphilum sp. X52 TaxID=2382159 RepID=UPI000F0A7683|nr:hypothetical protein [Proteiniphilum sp. X52]RNC64181.1 hypothetical protein D7D25_12445 [Proteiniphilum sp. X52]
MVSYVRKLVVVFLMIPVQSVSAQTLHNGIELGGQWPPRYEEPAAPREMPVPYLHNKPNVIPINVGRQLFVDDFLISETDLVRVFHTPTPYAGNPVLEPDREWEKTSKGEPYAAPFSDGIWYDDETGLFRMWYLAGAGNIQKNEKRREFYTCYAESKDGKNWTKPNLNLVPGTNIVDTCRRDAATIWLDRSEKDPSRRWKFFNIEHRDKDDRWQIVLKYSEDGIHWSKGKAQSGDMYDRTTAFFNPFTNKWALSMRGVTDLSFRSRFYAEHSDPEMLVSLAHRKRKDVEDRSIVYWFTPDDKELRHPKYPEVEPGIYNFDVIPYESIMIGQYAAWCGPENDVCAKDNIQKRNVVSLGYSRDGFHFSRPTHNAFIDVNETEGAWNWGNVQSINGTPLIVGDSLYFYASGRRLNDIFWDCYTSTGLFTLRRDGFVSMSAGKSEGSLTTEKITFDGIYLFVNADVSEKKGMLTVEILDENNLPIPGFTRHDCLSMKKSDKTKCMITWKGKNDLSGLRGKTVRFKFYLQNGQLYAFWVSPSEKGESRGFTAGGGPQLNNTGVDL